MESDSIFLPETSEGLTPQPHRPPSPAASRVKLLILVLVLTSCTSVQTPEAECGDPNWYLQVWRIGVPETQLDEPEGEPFTTDCIALADLCCFSDAAFILPQTSHGPLHCTTPADIYLLLKSSDFIAHDLDPGTAYQGCDDEDKEVRLELVLKRSVEINPAREMRCSVRENVLLGMSRALWMVGVLSLHQACRSEIRISTSTCSRKRRE